MIRGCWKALLFISMSGKNSERYFSTISDCGPVAQKGYLSFEAQTNQKCIAWASQPNLVCLSSESGGDLSAHSHACTISCIQFIVLSSCIKSHRCQACICKKLDDCWGIRGSNKNSNPDHFGRWSSWRENNNKSLPAAGIGKSKLHNRYSVTLLLG